jgi:hypothetical protein
MDKWKENVKSKPKKGTFMSRNTKKLDITKVSNNELN